MIYSSRMNSSPIIAELKRMSDQANYFLKIFLVMLCGMVSASGSKAADYHHQLVAWSETTKVPESSGIIAAANLPDVFWTHNDSGNYKPRIWAFRLSRKDRQKRIAPHMGWIELTGAVVIDWEDIARGPENYIYILDGGDSPPCRRTNKRIYRFQQPKIDLSPKTIHYRIPAEYIRFEYPSAADHEKPAHRNEDRYDSECLLVHPKNADIYVITKLDHRNKPCTRIFKLSVDRLDWQSSRVHILQPVTDLTNLLNSSDNIFSSITGGDCSPDGKRIVLRNYLAAYEFTLPESRPFEEIFQQRPKVFSLFGELQGEAIGYTHNGRDLITTTEAGFTGGDKFPVYLTTRPKPRSCPAETSHPKD